MKVTKKSIIGKVVQEHPEAIEAFLDHGMHCIGCGVSFYETIEQGAQVHGLKDLEKLIKDINKKIEKKSKK